MGQSTTPPHWVLVDIRGAVEILFQEVKVLILPPALCGKPDLAGEDGGGGEQDDQPAEHGVVAVAEHRVRPRGMSITWERWLQVCHFTVAAMSKV